MDQNNYQISGNIIDLNLLLQVELFPVELNWTYRVKSLQDFKSVYKIGSKFKGYYHLDFEFNFNKDRLRNDWKKDI